MDFLGLARVPALASFPDELTYHVCCAQRLEAKRVARKKEKNFIKTGAHLFKAPVKIGLKKN
jgi:hypothetical protein